jgi:hypothetical protein
MTEPEFTLTDYLCKHGLLEISADGEITENNPIPFAYGLPD